MSRDRASSRKGLSPRLVRLIRAARNAGQDAQGADIKSVARALEEFGDLALWAVPVHGLFVANNSDLCVVIDRIAKTHLALEDARRQFRKAVKVVESFEQRDAIESSHNDVLAVRDAAYFYAGLAFGVMSVDFA
jgi:hypothetical protein